MSKDKILSPLFSEKNVKKKTRFNFLGIGIGRDRDKNGIDNQLDSARFRELMGEWYKEEKTIQRDRDAGRKVSREDVQRIDRLRLRIITECIQILEKCNSPRSYRNLLETAACLYYEAARFRSYELIEIAQKYEQIAVHQLKLQKPTENVSNLFKGLPRARDLNHELSAIVTGDARFDEAKIKRISGELIALYYAYDENKLAPYDMGRIKFDYSTEHIEFNVLSLGGWIIAQLVLEAHSLGITDFSSYILLRNRIEDFPKR